MFHIVIVDATVIIVLRLVVGLALILGGSLKLKDLDGFAKLLRQYRVLPKLGSSVLGYSLPFLETLFGTAIALGLGQPWASIGGCLLFVMFSAAIAVNLSRKRHYLQCGCFGTKSGRTLSGALVYRNLALAAAALYSALPTHLHPSTKPTSPGPSLVIAFCITGIVAILLVCNAASIAFDIPGRRHRA